MLKDAGIVAAVCTDIPALGAALGPHTTFVIVAEEAMRSVDLRVLRKWIEDQPAWSDLPFIILTQRGGGPNSNPAAARLSDLFGNVTFLERPFHPTTLASLARSALKARLRQFEARARLEALHESEQKLATALLAGKLGSWEYDLFANTLSTSTLCKAHYGRAAEASFTFDDLLASIHPEDRDRMLNAVRASVETGTDYNIAYRVVWPDDSEHWVQINARMTRNASGQLRQMVGVSSDITAQKLAETDLRQMNEMLEKRVAERTSELVTTHAKVMHVEEQLHQAQKMEVIGQLTGGVAHDFNNLLMAVLANLDLLRKQHVGDPRALKLIDGALQGARRGAALTQRLLAFARRQSLQVEPRNLSDLVIGMKELLERSIGPTVELKLKLNDGLPMAMVDSSQVELALLNLAVNARDAMPDGGTLTIEIDEVAGGGATDLAPGRYLRLAMTDTGFGMDAETLQKAVEPFFSTKELGKGTGLGLSMVHGLAVQMNGALKMTSQPGVGTRAELWAPATTLAAPAMAAAPEPAAAAAPSRAKILLVDDDVLIAMSTAALLEDLGHEVIEANSGAEALGALRDKGPVDLLITDFAMPGMTGVQLANAAHDMLPGLPVLLATGYAELPKGTNVDLPRIGKPYSQVQLAKEIAKLLT